MKQPIFRKDLFTAVIDGKIPVAKIESQEITMDAGVDAPLHSHPCPTMGVVTEGTIVSFCLTKRYSA